jgi:hypothetical protein
MNATSERLSGNRLHLNYGPIDLIVGAFGPSDRVDHAYGRAEEIFQPILLELAGELQILRTPIEDLNDASGAGPVTGPVTGPVARRMVAVCRAHRDAWRDVWVTPMAAVAGAVADHVLFGMREAAPDLTKMFVNNGGDIALHVSGDDRFELGLVANPLEPAAGGQIPDGQILDGQILDGRVQVGAGDGIGGVATSGAGGRSFSLGIADAVTVLAASAAEADVAATLIANAVDLPGHPKIRRVPANTEDPDTDLGERPVTIAIGSLTRGEINLALTAGLAEAERFRAAGLIRAAALCLRGSWRTCGAPLVKAGSGG